MVDDSEYRDQVSFSGIARDWWLICPDKPARRAELDYKGVGNCWPQSLPPGTARSCRQARQLAPSWPWRMKSARPRAITPDRRAARPLYDRIVPWCTAQRCRRGLRGMG